MSETPKNSELTPELVNQLTDMIKQIITDNPANKALKTNATSSATAEGGSGGAGGHGGQALNITYVDNYAMLTLMSGFLQILTDKKNKISKESLERLRDMIEEEKKHREDFLKVLELLKQ